jgi:hypothetical protein
MASQQCDSFCTLEKVQNKIAQGQSQVQLIFNSHQTQGATNLNC